MHDDDYIIIIIIIFYLDTFDSFFLFGCLVQIDNKHDMAW